MCGSYERMNYITSFGFSIRWRIEFLKPIKSTNDAVEIIDLLTGMGETWNAARNQFPNANVTALDFSSEMLKKAHLKNEKHFGGHVTLLQQDILSNQLPGNYFDVVICSFGLKTFDQQQLEVLAKETKRILKRGGQFSFIEVSKPGNSVLNLLYGFYLQNIIPILGRLFLGNPSEYRMLWRYMDKFHDAKSTSKIFRKQGLFTINHSYFYGCATGFSGYKM